jgi:hypothetical protein
MRQAVTPRNVFKVTFRGNMYPACRSGDEGKNMN